MKESLAVTNIVYAVGLTIWQVVQAYRPTPKIRLSVMGLAVLQIGTVLMAALDGLSLLQGWRPQEMAVHLAYLAASLLVLPIMTFIGLAGRKEPNYFVLAIGSAAVVVIVVRLLVTGGV